MKCIVGIAVLALACQGAQAQRAAGDAEGSSRADETSAASEPGRTETQAQELSRAERRALRRSEEGAAAAAADAAVAAEATVAVTDDATEGDEGLICRREEVTGTHRRIRVCTTRAEREAMREASQELIRDSISRSRGPLGTEGQ